MNYGHIYRMAILFLAFKEHLFFDAFKVIIAIILLDRVRVFARIGAIMLGLCHGLLGMMGKNKHYTNEITLYRQ